MYSFRFWFSTMTEALWLLYNNRECLTMYLSFERPCRTRNEGDIGGEERSISLSSRSFDAQLGDSH
jgi:hypothetical protein